MEKIEEELKESGESTVLANEGKADDMQTDAIESMLKLWWTSYGEEDTFEDFVDNFFADGGEVMVPVELHVAEWIYSTRIKPPYWLDNRVFMKSVNRRKERMELEKLEGIDV